MDESTRINVENIQSTDKDLQNKAYYELMESTDKFVDWAYDVWDKLVADLAHKDNHVRAISAQLLSNLAKSDPEQRMLSDFDSLLDVTKDAKFVTARHCLQSLWKVGVAGEDQREIYLAGMEKRFQECAAEKNYTLIRYDISESLHNVYEATQDEAVKAKALELIETETDTKYRKKYTTVWK